MTELVVIVPMLGRGWRAAALVDEFARATCCEHRVVFVCNESDPDTIDACQDTEADLAVLPGAPEPGDWARKINLIYRHSDEELMLLGASDLSPRPGWDTDVLNIFDSHDVGVIGTNDLGNPLVRRGKHSTHPVVARCYVEAHGTIDGVGVVHEGYFHNYADTELVQTAMYRGCWRFSPRSIVEHLHPHWRKGQLDATYRRGLQRFDADRAVYRTRQHLWGGRRR